MNIGKRLWRPRLAGQLPRLAWRPIDFIGCQLFGQKFIGGSSIAEVLVKGAQFRRKGYSVTYNLLGEHVKDEKVVLRATETTLALIKAMDDSNLGNVSIKPTLYGLEISPELFRENAYDLIYSSKRAGIELEFDAERYECIEGTFEVFSELSSQTSLRRFVRQAVQAHLKDIVALMDKYGLWDKQIRIVKGSGVYSEKESIALGDPAQVVEQYLAILQANTLAGQVPYVATVRDRKLAMLVKEMFQDTNSIAFEMLYGFFGRGLGEDLLCAGYPVRIYIPFVADWCRGAWKVYGLRRAEMMRHLIFEEIKSKFRK